MTAFRVGMKVVLVRGQPRKGGVYDLANWPVVGEVYTVETITDHGRDRILLTLVEIDNSHMVPEYSKIEPGFHYSFFRPAVSRPTSIAVFQAMLTGKKAGVEA